MATPLEQRSHRPLFAETIAVLRVDRSLKDAATSIREIFLTKNQPNDKRFGLGVVGVCTLITAAVGSRNPDAPSIIQNLVSSVMERMQ